MQFNRNWCKVFFFSCVLKSWLCKTGLCRCNLRKKVNVGHVLVFLPLLSGILPSPSDNVLSSWCWVSDFRSTHSRIHYWVQPFCGWIVKHWCFYMVIWFFFLYLLHSQQYPDNLTQSTNKETFLSYVYQLCHWETRNCKKRKHSGCQCSTTIEKIRQSVHSVWSSLKWMTLVSTPALVYTRYAFLPVTKDCSCDAPFQMSSKH